MNSAIVVMGKVPSKGRVKTRLAKGLGEDGAELVVQLYRAFLKDVFLVVDRAEAQGLGKFTRVFSCALSDDEDLQIAERLAPKDWITVRQGGGGLGERIESARSAGDAAQGSPGAVLVLGSDAPTMRPARLVDALALLSSDLSGDQSGDLSGGRTVVVGPVTDGGYDLIGFSSAAPEVLHDIPWSTEAVLSVTRTRAKAAGISLRELPLAYDIDHLEDLQRALKDAVENDLAPHSRPLMAAALASAPKPL